jgi:hypothetical protein
LDLITALKSVTIGKENVIAGMKACVCSVTFCKDNPSLAGVSRTQSDWILRDSESAG